MARTGRARHLRATAGKDALPHRCDDALVKAPAASVAMSSSCCALVAPLTPIAPTTCPPTTMGTPPWSGVIASTATSAVRPLAMAFSKSRVALRNVAAVRALSMATVEAAGNVFSSRSR